jgi:hypothetical protein
VLKSMEKVPHGEGWVSATRAVHSLTASSNAAAASASTRRSPVHSKLTTDTAYAHGPRPDCGWRSGPTLSMHLFMAG